MAFIYPTRRENLFVFRPEQGPWLVDCQTNGTAASDGVENRTEGNYTSAGLDVVFVNVAGTGSRVKAGRGTDRHLELWHRQLNLQVSMMPAM